VSQSLFEPVQRFANQSVVLLGQVTVTPSSAGLPGSALIQKLLNWGQMLALWGSLGAILVGAAIAGLAQHGGSYSGASSGKKLIMAGAGGALVAGLAPTIINTLFTAAQ